MLRSLPLLALLAAFSFACDDPEPTTSAPPLPDPAPTPEPEPEPANDEACARVLAVAYAGTAMEVPGVTRSAEDARARIDGFRARVQGGEDMGALARAESDSRQTAARDGLIGTYVRGEFPEIFGMVEAPIFGVGVGEVTEVLEAPFGYVFAERCAVEKVHVRHILIRYAGAPGASAETGGMTRSKDEARELAERIRARVIDDEGTFEDLAAEFGEDGSKDRGGDLGPRGRGLFEPPFEAAAFALQPGEVAPVTETRFGFHVIRREPEG
ncbi:MAG: peptidylprolyl isomerase [Myxococcota bacterium]